MIENFPDLIHSEMLKIIFYISAFIDKKRLEAFFIYEKSLLKRISDYKDLLNFFQTNFESKMSGLFLFKENLLFKNSLNENDYLDKAKKFISFNPNKTNTELLNEFKELKIGSFDSGFQNIYETKKFSDKLKESILYHYRQLLKFNINEQNYPNNNLNTNELKINSNNFSTNNLSNFNNNFYNSNNNNVHQMNNQLEGYHNNARNNFENSVKKNSRTRKFRVNNKKKALSISNNHKNNNNYINNDSLNLNKNSNNNDNNDYYSNSFNANYEKPKSRTERIDSNSRKYRFHNHLSNRSSQNITQSLNFNPTILNSSMKLASEENINKDTKISPFNINENEHFMVLLKEEINERKKFSFNYTRPFKENQENNSLKSSDLNFQIKKVSSIPTLNAYSQLNNLYSIKELSEAESSPFPNTMLGIIESGLHSEKKKLNKEGEEIYFSNKNVNKNNYIKNSLQQESEKNINFDIPPALSAKNILHTHSIYKTINKSSSNDNNANFSGNNCIEKSRFSLMHANATPNKISSKESKECKKNKETKIDSVVQKKKTHVISELSEEESPSFSNNFKNTNEEQNSFSGISSNLRMERELDSSASSSCSRDNNVNSNNCNKQNKKIKNNCYINRSNSSKNFSYLSDIDEKVNQVGNVMRSIETLNLGGLNDVKGKNDKEIQEQKSLRDILCYTINKKIVTKKTRSSIFLPRQDDIYNIKITKIKGAAFNKEHNHFNYFKETDKNNIIDKNEKCPLSSFNKYKYLQISKTSKNVNLAMIYPAPATDNESRKTCKKKDEFLKTLLQKKIIKIWIYSITKWT